METDNRESLAQHGVALYPIQGVELSICVQGEEKLARHSVLELDAVAYAAIALLKDAAERWGTDAGVQIVLTAEWRELLCGEDGENDSEGDKVGEDAVCILEIDHIPESIISAMRTEANER